MTSIALPPASHGVTTFGARAPGVPDASAASDEWARLWFTLEQHGWGSLALVPAARGASARVLAAHLAQVARDYASTSVDVLDAEDAGPEDVQAVLATMGSQAGTGGRVLVVLASPLERAPAIPLARAADAALLVVPLEASGVGDARRTIGMVGGAHFVGSVTVRARWRR